MSEWDSKLITALENLGKANEYVEYLALLNSSLKDVKIFESGEKMLFFPKHLKDVFVHPGELKIRIDENERLFLRESVVEKLNLAQSKLPNGFHLLITDAFRSEDVVWKLYNYYLEKLKEREPGISDQKADSKLRNILAMPDDIVPPGHMTGGAVDVVLADEDGQEIPLRVDESLIPKEKQSFFECPGLPKEIVEKRKILFEAMTSVGFNNYFREFWHYSYGDAYWAVRRAKKQSFYGIPEKKLFEQIN